jgi:hypothetical protein
VSAICNQQLCLTTVESFVVRLTGQEGRKCWCISTLVKTRITMQTFTHSVGKPRRSTPSSAAFSRHSTFHNRISSSPNILPCLPPAFSGRTSGHRLITIRVVNFIFFNLIMNLVPVTASTCFFFFFFFFFFFLSSLYLLLNFHTFLPPVPNSQKCFFSFRCFT